MSGPILVCYDGSEGARTALELAADLLAPGEAVVASYWQPFAETTKRLGVDLLELVQDPAAINEREQQLAEQLATEGAERARELGLEAEPRAIQIDGPIDEAILLHAEELDACLIVLGARKRSTLRSLLVGAVANEVLQRATRPVLVAPSDRLAKRRRRHLVAESPATGRAGS
jgi:nucleotide-binding universal stress UspA family protein